MFDNAGIPDMGDAQIFYFAEHAVCNVIKFATPVLCDVAVWHTCLTCVREQPWKHLIDYRFQGLGLFMCCRFLLRRFI